jgi:hypothetical protein
MLTKAAQKKIKIDPQKHRSGHHGINNQQYQQWEEHLFFSSPVRKAASANEARRLPLPASLLHTAYSLTKACI